MSKRTNKEEKLEKLNVKCIIKEREVAVKERKRLMQKTTLGKRFRRNAAR